jgi:hypothetical protein
MNTTDPRVLASGPHCDLAQAIAKACDLTRGLARAADTDLIYASHLAREIAREISRASDLANKVNHAYVGLEADLANADVHASSLVRHLAQIQDRARVRDRVFVRFEVSATVSNLGRAGKLVGIAAAPGRRQVMPSAKRLLDAAARVLPAADRARYADEYRSELWELAHAGAGCLRQLRYALRQLRRAPSMGFTLRSPHRRSATP